MLSAPVGLDGVTLATSPGVEWKITDYGSEDVRAEYETGAWTFCALI